jgi:hypothetical protein
VSDTHGDHFRTAIEAEFADSDPDSDALLREACDTLDEIERMRAALDRDGLTVDGSKGQPRAHPLISELRAHRDAFARITERLFPGEQESATQLTRRAARARWGKATPRSRGLTRRVEEPVEIPAPNGQRMRAVEEPPPVNAAT